jgi:hypothetical protein
MTGVATRCDGSGYVPHDGDPGHFRYDEDGTMLCQACAGDGCPSREWLENEVAAVKERLAGPLEYATGAPLDDGELEYFAQVALGLREPSTGSGER